MMMMMMSVVQGFSNGRRFSRKKCNNYLTEIHDHSKKKNYCFPLKTMPFKLTTKAILKILSVCCAPTDPPKSPRPKFFFRYFRFFIFFWGVSTHSDRTQKTDIKGALGLPKSSVYAQILKACRIFQSVSE